MRRNNAEVRRLVQGGADVKLRASRRRHGAALGGLLRRCELGVVVARGRRRRLRPPIVNGSTPMWLAASQGDAADDRGAARRAARMRTNTLPLGRRPLMLAARSGHVDAVRALLDRGADVNAKEDARGTTALMQAADQGHADVIARADRARCRCRGDVRAGRARRAHGGTRQVRRSPRSGAAASHRDPVRSGDPGSEQARGADSPKAAKMRCWQTPAGRRVPTANPATFSVMAWASSLAGGRRNRRHSGSRRRRAHAAGVRGAHRQRRCRARAARSRRRREPDDPLRLEPAARSHAKPQLSAREIPHRARRRRESRQQGRLDAAVSRDRQPQPRGRRLSHAARPTWTISSTSSCSSTRARIRMPV